MTTGPDITILQRPGEAQHAWLCKDLASSFYSNKDKATTKLLGNVQNIQDAHLLLWPNVDCPDLVRLGDERLSQKKLDTQPAALPMTLVIATVLHLFSATGRQGEARLKAAAFLKVLVESACQAGLPLRVALVKPDGSYRYQEAVWTSPTQATLFSDAMLLDITSYWQADMSAGNKPWLTTTAEGAHLADFLCLCLDPVPVKASKHLKQLKDLKALLRLTALGLLTQIANFYCQQECLKRVTISLSKRRRVEAGQGKRQRMHRSHLWPLLGRAFHAMVEGTASCCG